MVTLLISLLSGKTPVPGDLLNEPLHVIPATAGLLDSEIQEAQSVRASAREAVVELQDDRALRQALLARPRVSQDFRAGELVAYWRQQKYSQAQKRRLLAWNRNDHW